MSQKKTSPVTIGAFVLGALALIAAAIITLGGAALFTTKQHAVIYFEGNVNGLAVGSPVNFRGVRVGQVERITLQFDAGTLTAHIPVQIALVSTQVRMMGGVDDVNDIPFQTFIDKGLRAKLDNESIVTGQLNIDLDFRPETPAVFVGPKDEDLPEIPAVKSDFDVLKDQLAKVPFRQLADDVKSLVESIRVLTGSTDQALGVLGQEMQLTASSARRTMDTATATLQTMQATMKAAERTANSATDTMVSISPALKSTLVSAESAMKRAESTLANADAAMLQAAEITAPGAPVRAELEQTLRDLSAAAESLRAFSDTIDRQPNAVLFGKD